MEIHLRTVVVDCEDGRRAANFYSKLLGWPITMEDNGWVLLRDPNGGTGLSFETEENYVRPVWPEEPGKPMKMLHLDFQVDDLTGRRGPRLGLRRGEVPPAVFRGPGGHRVLRHRGPPLLPVLGLSPRKQKERASQPGGPFLFGEIFSEKNL